MARIHIDIESNDELPDLATLLQSNASTTRSTRTKQKSGQSRIPKTQSASAKDQSTATKSRQRTLPKSDVSQSLFGAIDAAALGKEGRLQTRRIDVRSSPKKGKPVKQIQIFEDVKVEEVELSCQNCEDNHAPTEESFHISEDAVSDDESWLGLKKDRESPFRRLLKSRPKSKLSLDDPMLQLSPTKVTDQPNPFLGPRIAPPLVAVPPLPSSSRPTSSSSALDQPALLHYTPQKRLSPSKKLSMERPSTPPQDAPPSPSKKLNSPTKSRVGGIPHAGIRESIDAFWAQDVVNDWNEQYSPRKMVASPRKNRFATPTSDDENGPPSPSTSPRKSRSPQKSASPVKSREAREMKKAWDKRKKQIAQDFLQELDKTIVDGKLAELAAATGGVQLIWSKKLNTTAGRANWRREKIRDPQPDGSISTWYRHTANIELAEKVIDDEVKLINVVAHEFCHLCNFMVNGMRDNPHGKEFKEWAKKVSRAFGNRGIEVTTKHSYDIDYKYVWECVECSLEFKRHSKSIDTTKQACGACKGRLVQTKPLVRANANGPSEYHLFVKEHCQRLKRENPGVAHGVIMEMLGKSYREQKGTKNASVGIAEEKVDVDSMVRELEVITLDD